MNHPPARVLQQLLIDGGLGVDPATSPSSDWQIFVSSMAASTIDNALCVYDTAGVQDGRLMITGEPIIHYGWQVRVRGVDYPVGYNKGIEILRHFWQVKSQLVVVDSTTYKVHNISTGILLPIGLDPDFKRRPLFTLNGTATIKAV